MMKRAVGYCLNKDCENVYRGAFLLNHGSEFWCPACRQSGICEKEIGVVLNDSELFKEVRIEYAFDPTDQKYHSLLILKRDLPKWDVTFNVYTLYSPMINSEKRATFHAEKLLGQLDQIRIEDLGTDLRIVPRETILDLGCTDNEWSKELRLLDIRLTNSHVNRFAQRQEKSDS